MGPLLYQNCNAQNTQAINQAIVLDLSFADPLVISPKYVDSKSVQTIQIRNINPYLYSVNILEIQRYVVYDDEPISEAPFDIFSSIKKFEIEDIPFFQIATGDVEKRQVDERIVNVDNKINLVKDSIMRLERLI
jgi:hypothetical protein